MLDSWIVGFDRALRTLTGLAQSTRPIPGAGLQDRPSLLNPLWYAGSFAIGTLAGLAGDRVNLGFVVETERQVEEHLTAHLDRLPDGDAKSRAIVVTMRDDEARHGAMAQEAGAFDLPRPV